MEVGSLSLVAEGLIIQSILVPMYRGASFWPGVWGWGSPLIGKMVISLGSAWECLSGVQIQWDLCR